MGSPYTVGDPSLTPAQTIFTCEHLNSTTFFITENDCYGEHPFIYVKIYQKPPLMIISDTGCGGSTVQTSDNLWKFLETYRVAADGHQPLNPRKVNGEPSLPYFIIFTHCHYDHILGVTSFQGLSLATLAIITWKIISSEMTCQSTYCAITLMFQVRCIVLGC